VRGRICGQHRRSPPTADQDERRLRRRRGVGHFLRTRSTDQVGRKSETTLGIARLHFEINTVAGTASDQFKQPPGASDVRNGVEGRSDGLKPDASSASRLDRTRANAGPQLRGLPHQAIRGNGCLGRGPVGDRSTVEPRTLTPLILVRIQVPQPGILLKSLRICSFLARRNSLETSAR
jgi:hypothetical protein